MSAAFTPGPWLVNEPPQTNRRVMMPNDCIEIRSPQSGMVACLYAVNADIDGTTDRANASLIAAAPELYEALERLDQAIDFDTDEDATDALAAQLHIEDKTALVDALFCAKAALAKAAQS